MIRKILLQRQQKTPKDTKTHKNQNEMKCRQCQRHKKESHILVECSLLLHTCEVL